MSEATSDAVRSLFGVVEGYPELRSQENVMALQQEIERLETLIARRRELFNEQVYQYDLKVTTLPGLVLRPFFGWKTVEMFSAEEAEKAVPGTRPEASR